MSRVRTLLGLVFLLALSSTSAKAQYKPVDNADPNPFQIGIGYSFVSFNEIPHPSTVLNNSGVNGSAVWYNNIVGSEAEVSDVFGSQNGHFSQLLFAGGGGRVRWPVGRNFEPWAHALIGYTHLTPETSFGSNSALGYKLGGGLDFYARHRRIAYRVSADMLGTTFFHTSQFSPEASVGIVFLFGR